MTAIRNDSIAVGLKFGTGSDWHLGGRSAVDAPAKACRNELNRPCRDSRGADSCCESLQAKPETQRWHWGSRKKDPKGSVAHRVYDDDLSTDQETDSDIRAGVIAAGAISIRTRIEGRIKTSCKTSLSDCYVMNSGALGEEVLLCEMRLPKVRYQELERGVAGGASPCASCFANNCNEVSIPCCRSTGRKISCMTHC